MTTNTHLNNDSTIITKCTILKDGILVITFDHQTIPHCQFKFNMKFKKKHYMKLNH